MGKGRGKDPLDEFGDGADVVLDGQRRGHVPRQRCVHLRPCVNLIRDE